jgi:hypothetical protein
MDRRADPRVEVKLPCHVAFPRSKSGLFVGVTENMSRGGILVSWSADRMLTNLPKAGDLLTVDIELPANHSFGRRCMHCQAVVARVLVGESGCARVAFQVNQMQFRSYANGKCASAANRDQVSCSLM